jgi:hypothetical protein
MTKGKILQNLFCENVCDVCDVVIDIDKNVVVDSDREINILSHNLSPNLSQPISKSETPLESDDNRIRIASRQEFGIHGWVDLRVIAARLKLPEEQVRAWLDTHYTKTDHEFGYKQRASAL